MLYVLVDGRHKLVSSLISMVEHLGYRMFSSSRCSIRTNYLISLSDADASLARLFDLAFFALKI